MSDIFALDLAGNKVAADQAARSPYVEAAGPGWFDRAPAAIGMGIARGGVLASRATSILSAAPVAAYESLTGQQGRYSDRWFRSVDEESQAAIDFWTPNAATTGAASNVLGGLAEMTLQLAATGGDPALLLASMETNPAVDLVNQGVDAETAVRVGLAQGAAGAVGFRLPILGKTLTGRLATGAAGNLAANTSAMAVSQVVLEQQGYSKAAAEFDPMNLEARMVDVLAGAAFGGIHHLGARGEPVPVNVAPEIRDAALSALNARHVADIAPGRPANIEALVAHNDATELAFEQLLRGEPVDVAKSGVQDAEFIGPPKPALEIPRAKTLPEAQRTVETAFADNLARDPAAAETAYANLEDANGGKVLNTDTARELSPDYLKDRTLSAAVHEPASWLIKRLYEKALRAEPRAGEENLVLFTAGGTGAGKSTAVKDSLGTVADRAQIVYDSNMSDSAKAITRIKQALDAGKHVKVAYVFRDPAEALTHGALTRAMRQEGEFGSGRTVPLAEHVNTHAGAREAIPEIAAHFAGDPRVEIAVIDNSRGKGKAAVVDLADLPQIDYTSTHERATQALEKEFKAGRISEQVYRGFRGEQAVAERVGAADSGQPEPQRGQGTADQVVERARVETEAVASNLDAAGLTEEAETLRGDYLKPPEITEAPKRGRISVVYTAAGRPVEVRPMLVELDTLVTSDQSGYPNGIQPRDRGDRVASGQQISKIARELRPAELGDSATADTGAPIVGADRAVESGNGRVMALREMYAKHPENAAKYRAWLESRGHDVAGMRMPVEVRERATPMTDAERQAFAIEANKAGVAEMSPVERAKADAQMLDDATMATLEGGDVTLARNAGFVKAFISQLTEAERGAMQQADGTLSLAGERRIEGALLARAYGGNPEAAGLLAKILESTENDVKTVTGALMDAAPDIARMRASIEAGKADKSFDITAEIIKAVNELIAIKRTGRKLFDAMSQVDAFNPRDPKVTEILKAFMDDKMTRMASRDTIARTLKNYADEAQRLNLEQGDIFGDKPPAPEAMLRAVRGNPPEADALPQTDLFAVAPARDAAPAVDGQVAIGETGEVAPSAEKALTDADAAIEKAQQDAKGIEAAVACFLAKGVAA